MERIVSWQRSGLMCVAVLCLTATAGAEWTTQTLTLEPGWNAVHLTVQPEENSSEAVFAHPAIQSVWAWNKRFRSVQYVRDPETLLPSLPDWLVYFPAGNRNAELTTLHQVFGGNSYLVKVGSDEAVTLRVLGETSLKDVSWNADSFNLVGFPVDPAAPIRLADYFVHSKAHRGQPVYSLLPEGTWVEVADPDTYVIKRGEAYWVYCDGPSDYEGPLGVTVRMGGELNFGALLTEQKLKLTNNSSEPKEIVLRLRETQSVSRPRHSAEPPVMGAVSLAYYKTDLAKLNIGWESVVAPWVVTVPAGGETEVLLGVQRGAMPSPEIGSAVYESVLEVRDGSGMLYEVPVKALKVGGNAGLWVGSVSVTEVSETQNTAEPTLTTPTASEFVFRVIIHLDEAGVARLLQQVIVAEAPEAIDTPAHYAIVTDESILNAFRRGDGKIVGRRLSAPVFGFDAPIVMTGAFSTSLSCDVVMDYNDPLNPFVHRYHPDHDNLNARYEETLLPEGDESFTFTRRISFEFSSDHPDGIAPPEWSDTLLGGTYREVVSGVHRKTIYTKGTFLLQRVSGVAVLNDGI